MVLLQFPESTPFPAFTLNEEQEDTERELHLSKKRDVFLKFQTKLILPSSPKKKFLVYPCVNFFVTVERE